MLRARVRASVRARVRARFKVRVKGRVKGRVRVKVRAWLGLGLRGDRVHLDKVVRREEVDREQHDEMHRDIGTPRRDDLHIYDALASQ